MPEAAQAESGTGKTRAEKHAKTHAKLLKAAVQALIEEGVARTTTLEVQRRAGVSRGALLHHFPTHAALLSATVAQLVEMNEVAIWHEAETLSERLDPVERAIRTLANAFEHPSFAAELELWAVSRTDEALRNALRDAERKARDSRDRVLHHLFGETGDTSQITLISELTVQFIRGLTLSRTLHSDRTKRDNLTSEWIDVARRLLDAPKAE